MLEALILTGEERVASIKPRLKMLCLQYGSA